MKNMIALILLVFSAQAHAQTDNFFEIKDNKKLEQSRNFAIAGTASICLGTVFLLGSNNQFFGKELKDVNTNKGFANAGYGLIFLGAICDGIAINNILRGLKDDRNKKVSLRMKADGLALSMKF